MATSRKNMSAEEWQLLANIGQMYKDLRAEAGLTQREAVRKLGTSQGQLSMLECGQADVMVTTLQRWASVYGYEVQISLVPIEDKLETEKENAA